MQFAVCFKCGFQKSGALVACESCHAIPLTNSEHAVSLALSDHISTKTQLAQYSHELSRHLKLSVPRETLVRALDALKDPQVRARLLPQPKPSTTKIQRPPPVPSETRQRTPIQAQNKPTLRLTTSALHQSPFGILRATVRDDRKRIVELAEEKSLGSDHDVCQKARSDLTHPRTRLSAEMAWFPGVSPSKASQLVEGLLHDPMAARETPGLPTLAHLNLLAAAFESVDGEYNSADLISFIKEAACLAEALHPKEILRDINEDRAVSGFPIVQALDQIEAELVERKRYYRNAIKGALDKLPTRKLIQVLTDTVDGVTSSGEDHAPALVDDLVDSYEAETQGILQKEAENVHKLIQAIRDSAESGEAAVKPLIDKLASVACNWDMIAQPIQLSAKARGIDHEPSRDLAYKIRSLAIDLFNHHDMLAQSQRLTSLLHDLFSEVPDVAECVEEDADTLADISQRRSEAAAIDPIRKLVERVLRDIESSPSNANHEGQRLLDEGGALLKAAALTTDSPAGREAKDILAAGIMQCAIAYGNESSKWAPCLSLIEKALDLASDAKLREKLNENLDIVRTNHEILGDLEPINDAPSLTTINGIGVTLYGQTDQKSDGSYMATYYFVLLAIPIFPIARYRVKPTGRGYRFLGKGRLRTFDKWHIAVTLGLILLLFLKG